MQVIGEADSDRPVGRETKTPVQEIEVGPFFCGGSRPRECIAIINIGNFFFFFFFFLILIDRYNRTVIPATSAIGLIDASVS